MLPGEIIGKRTTTCECGEILNIRVLKSNKHYIGFLCPKCGPYSRESGYYESFEEAEEALTNNFGR